METPERARRHALIATELALRSDRALENALAEARPGASGIGGATAVLDVSEIRVFVKRIALTDLERRPENRHSTANLFHLPLAYQYGIGSAGFGAWRELAAHVIATATVLAEPCAHFPLLHHARVLTRSPRPEPDGARRELEASVAFWDGSPEIRARLEAREAATAELVLFIEHFPWTLSDWLPEQLARDDARAQAAAKMVEGALDGVTRFCGQSGFVHFDAHFANMLTDGETVVLGDFGLTLAHRFDLTTAEQEFVQQHWNYDRAVAFASLVHWALPREWAADERRRVVEAYAAGDHSVKFSPAVTGILERHAPVAKVVKDFMRALTTESRSTPYPVSAVESALARRR